MMDLADNALAAWRVLIVEDEVDNAELIHRLLRHYGAEVILAQDGVEALNHLRASDFTIVVCDLSMPKLDGWALIREVRALKGKRTIPVIALTAHAMYEDRERVLQAGFTGYYVKPVEDIFDLLSYLMTIVRNQRASAP